MTLIPTPVSLHHELHTDPETSPLPTSCLFHPNCLLIGPQEMEQRFERERLSLEEQKTLLRQQLDELREELTSKLNQANQEVSDLAISCAPPLDWRT